MGKVTLGAQDGIDNKAPGGSAARGRARKDEGSQVGSALREAYRATVEEAVPDEMLDLLNKLR